MDRMNRIKTKEREKTKIRASSCIRVMTAG